MGYRFVVPGPNGNDRTFESDKSVDEIHAAHPRARITHEVVLDDDGRFVRADPYVNKQPKVAKGDPADEPGAVAPVKSAEKAASKRSG